ncbi:hypothetical protein AND_001874 [Anopheles darlingi]|uniref:Uncharacterized protein n=1 Tax=Anopheles darlingi TaxID=43151 RepID=W5JSR1_ANODA|nr:hypothetical protein AND_001874 [Anopheles darlingi]
MMASTTGPRAWRWPNVGWPFFRDETQGKEPEEEEESESFGRVDHHPLKSQCQAKAEDGGHRHHHNRLAVTCRGGGGTDRLIRIRRLWNSFDRSTGGVTEIQFSNLQQQQGLWSGLRLSS